MAVILLWVFGFYVWIENLAHDSVVQLSSAQQFAHWWHNGCNCRAGMDVFENTSGHSSHLFAVFAVASVFGISHWRSGYVMRISY